MTKESQWHWPGPDRSGPGRGRQAKGCPVSGRPRRPRGQGRQGHEPDRLHGRGCRPWQSWRRSCRLAGCTRPAVASCRQSGASLYGKIVEQLKLTGQPVPGEADQPNGDQSGTDSLPQACRPAGTTLLSATW